MDRRRILWTLTGLALVALALRLTAIIVLNAWNHPNEMEHGYVAFALSQGWGFWFRDFGHLGPSSVQSPPYPLILFLAYKIFGVYSPGAFAAVMVLNAFVGAGTVFLTYALARTLGAKVKVGLIAAGLIAVWPSQIYAATVSQAICLIVAAQAAMVIYFYRGVRTGGVRPWVIFSAVACLAALTEPALLPIAVLSGLLVLNWPALLVTQRLRNAAILFACALLIIGPWTVRNRLVHGKWIPIKNSFWTNVWKGANDYATGTDRVRLSDERRRELASRQMFALDDSASRPHLGVGDPTANQADDVDGLHHRDMLTTAEVLQLWGRPEVQQEGVFEIWAKTWIKAHPQRFVELCFARLAKTVWIDWDNPKSYSVIYVVPKAVLLLGTVAGLVVALRRRWTLFYPTLLIGSCVALYTLTLTAARFSIPFEPLQLCLSAQALMSAWEWVRRRVSQAELTVASATLEAT